MSDAAPIHCVCQVPLPFRVSFDAVMNNRTKNVEMRRLLCCLNTISEQTDAEQGFNMRKQVCPTCDSWDAVRKLYQSHFPWQLAAGTVNTRALPQCLVLVLFDMCCLKVLFVLLESVTLTLSLIYYSLQSS